MNSADIRGMFAGLPGAHGIIEAALNGQGRVMTDDAARPSSAAVLAGDFLFFGGEPAENARPLRPPMKRASQTRAQNRPDSVSRPIRP